jgi:uncharacterized membrane protein YfcA
VTLVLILLGTLAVCSAIFALRWWQAVRHGQTSRDAPSAPTAPQLAIGFVTNFFDTLGIGSFATTTAAFRLLRIVPDEIIPGTMLVGHSLPVVAQAMIFIGAIGVDPWQMAALIAMCVLGGWTGAGIVASLSRRAVQVGMGTGLLVAATFMLLGMLGGFPAGGAAMSLAPGALVFALIVNFALGALVTLGIGNYAPSLIMFSLLGMEPRAAFPIMAGSGAFVATIAGVRFIRAGRFHRSAALGLTLGGIPGVIVAAWLVQSLPLDTMRWLVLAVVIYAAVSLLRAGMRGAVRVVPVSPREPA